MPLKFDNFQFLLLLLTILKKKLHSCTEATCLFITTLTCISVHLSFVFIQLLFPSESVISYTMYPNNRSSNPNSSAFPGSLLIPPPINTNSTAISTPTAASAAATPTNPNLFAASSSTNNNTIIIISELPLNCNELELLNLARQFGEVKSCEMKRDFRNHVTTVYGVVAYYNPEDARNAIQRIHGVTVDDKLLQASWFNSNTLPTAVVSPKPATPRSIPKALKSAQVHYSYLSRQVSPPPHSYTI